MLSPVDQHDPTEAAAAALAAAREAAAAAQAAGRPYAIAMALTRVGHALLMLDRPAEALADFDEALPYLDLIRADGEHERLRMLSMASLSLAPPGEELGDLDGLEAWIRVGRAGALAKLGRTVEARVAIDEAAPFVRGWSRRPLRRALEQVSASLGDAPTGPPARRPAGGPMPAPSGTPADRLERAADLVESGDLDAGMREALLLIRDSEDDPAEAARARQVLGAALAMSGRDDEADATLLLAFESFVRLDDHTAVLAAAPGLAARLIDSGRPGDAAGVIETALRSARARSDAISESDMLAALGIARDEMGEQGPAARALAEAVEAAERAGDALRAADARHGQAVVLGRGGGADDAVEALSLLDAARATYESEGFTLRAAGCQHEAAALLGRLGSLDAARIRYAGAADAYRATMAADAHEGELIDAAIADCTANIAVLSGMAGAGTAPEHAFASGGHRMAFGAGFR